MASDLNYLRATEAKEKLSHAPNSKFRVGVYLETTSLDFSAGNIEHDNSMLNICAERMALALAKGRKSKPKHLHLVSDNDDPIFPCGVCRQYMAEFPNLLVTSWSNSGTVKITKTVNQLFPNPYKRKK